MKIPLAGPGTGKTTNIKKIVQENTELDSILIISFTNATVEDLKKSLSSIGLNSKNCMTLHKFAVKYNHDKTRHVLDLLEVKELEKISKGTSINFNNLCDFFSATTFDQMIYRFTIYARSNPKYLKEKLSKYSVLIIDEYQDFNHFEQELIDLLIMTINESYILGDDDQCIYDFKDADNDKIISIYSDKSNEKIVHEHKCFRCPDVIVDSATKLIKNNIKRIDKKWEKSGKEGSLFQVQFYSNEDTANYIHDEIKNILKNSSDEKILILSPVGFLTKNIQNYLESSKLEYRNYFTCKVEPQIIKKSWILRMIFGNYKYLNLALIGYDSITSRRKFYEIIKKHYDREKDFNELLDTLNNKLPKECKFGYKKIDEFIANPFFSELSSYYYSAMGDNESEKLENLFTMIDEDVEKQISIMSIHKSKGLGADHVFMIGLIEGIIPNSTRGNDSIESQRRLFYVGMTRAKKKLHLLSSIDIEGKYVNTVNKADFKYDFHSKIWKGRVSRFIEEINI